VPGRRCVAPSLLTGLGLWVGTWFA